MSEGNGEQFKLLLGCMVNEQGEMQLHVNTTNEALLALALRRLSQAIDVKMIQEVQKQKSNIIQATSVINRIIK